MGKFRFSKFDNEKKLKVNKMKIETDRRKKEEDEFVIKNLITIRSSSYKIKNSVNRLYKNAEIQRVKLKFKFY